MNKFEHVILYMHSYFCLLKYFLSTKEVKSFFLRELRKFSGHIKSFFWEKNEVGYKIVVVEVFSLPELF